MHFNDLSDAQSTGQDLMVGVSTRSLLIGYTAAGSVNNGGLLPISGWAALSFAILIGLRALGLWRKWHGSSLLVENLGWSCVKVSIVSNLLIKGLLFWLLSICPSMLMAPITSFRSSDEQLHTKFNANAVFATVGMALVAGLLLASTEGLLHCLQQKFAQHPILQTVAAMSLLLPLSLAAMLQMYFAVVGSLFLPVFNLSFILEMTFTWSIAFGVDVAQLVLAVALCLDTMSTILTSTGTILEMVREAGKKVPAQTHQMQDVENESGKIFPAQTHQMEHDGNCSKSALDLSLNRFHSDLGRAVCVTGVPFFFAITIALGVALCQLSGQQPPHPKTYHSKALTPLDMNFKSINIEDDHFVSIALEGFSNNTLVNYLNLLELEVAVTACEPAKDVQHHWHNYMNGSMFVALTVHCLDDGCVMYSPVGSSPSHNVHSLHGGDIWKCHGLLTVDIPFNSTASGPGLHMLKYKGVGCQRGICRLPKEHQWCSMDESEQQSICRAHSNPSQHAPHVGVHDSQPVPSGNVFELVMTSCEKIVEAVDYGSFKLYVARHVLDCEWIESSDWSCDMQVFTGTSCTRSQNVQECQTVSKYDVKSCRNRSSLVVDDLKQKTPVHSDKPPVPALSNPGQVNNSQARRLWSGHWFVEPPPQCGYIWSSYWCWDFSAQIWIYTDAYWKTYCGKWITQEWELDACSGHTFDQDVWWAWTWHRGWFIHKYPKPCEEEYVWSHQNGVNMLWDTLGTVYENLYDEKVFDPVDMYGVRADEEEGLRSTMGDSEWRQFTSLVDRMIVFENEVCAAAVVGDDVHEERCTYAGDEAGEPLTTTQDGNTYLIPGLHATSYEYTMCGFQDTRKATDCDMKHRQDACYCLNHAWGSFWGRWRWR